MLVFAAAREGSLASMSWTPSAVGSAVLLGAAFLQETVTTRAGIGGVLVLCGIFMITITFQRSRS